MSANSERAITDAIDKLCEAVQIIASRCVHEMGTKDAGNAVRLSDEALRLVQDVRNGDTDDAG